MKYLILVDDVFYLRNVNDPATGGWFLEDITRIMAAYPNSKFQIFPNSL